MNMELMSLIVDHYKRVIVESNDAILSGSVAEDLIPKSLARLKGFKEAVELFMAVCVRDGKVPISFFEDKGLVKVQARAAAAPDVSLTNAGSTVSGDALPSAAVEGNA